LSAPKRRPGRPRLVDALVHLPVRVRPELRDAVRREAERRGVSVSALAAELVEVGLGRR